MSSGLAFIISCEHAGNHMPKKYQRLLGKGTAVLATHEAFDPGTLALGKSLFRKLGGEIFTGRTTRLLINLNRSPDNPRRFSRYTRTLPPAEKHAIEERYYTPYRSALQSAVEQAVAKKKTVIHLCIHSFAPELKGKQRSAHIGLLYDPSRRKERALCNQLKKYFFEILPELTVRMNYPYLGIADGFATYLRKRLPGKHYIGIELEVNQQFLTKPRVPASLGDILAKFFLGLKSGKPSVL